MLFGELTTEERMSRIKIQLQDEHPFWAYLIMKLSMYEHKGGKLPPWKGPNKSYKNGAMGISAKGELYWGREFVDDLTEDQLKFCLAHEVGHLVFAHLMRLGNRDPMAFNVASDVVLNEILVTNGFIAVPGSIIPHNHEVTLGETVIKDVDKKSAEDVYDELPKLNFKNSNGGSSSGSGSDDDNSYSYKGFDHHEYGDGMSQSEQQAAAEKWKDATMEAAQHARNRGKLPAGMEELIGDIMNPKFNWKQLLRKFITNTLPFDYSFSRPNRKIPGMILPGVVKETVDIVVHVDTSGSVSPKELNMFMSEIIGIATSHHNLNMTLLECDADIQQVVEVNSRNISKLKNLVIKGRGGTSHKPIWEWIAKNKPACKLFVSLTDLCSDIELSDKPRYEVVWITPNSQWCGEAPFGRKLVVK